jgi:heptaprenylglyceryl phosphate synthase
MKNYYILVTSDFEQVSAYKIFENRLKEKKFPLYLKTPHLENIKQNDEVIFYIAGINENAQSFVAKSNIKSVEIVKELLVDADKKKNLVNRYLILESTTLFEKPKSIRPIIEKLDFIRKKLNFGAYLVGGVVKLDDKDFNTILNS